MRRLITGLVAVLRVGGYATGPTSENYVPLIDVKEGQRETYSKDLSECQSYAASVVGAGDVAVGSAVAGALLMGAISAIIGGGGHGRWVAVDALTGAAQGAAHGETNQRDVIRRCMNGRGYSVLN